jgi:flagellar biogenesis protein FliO
MTLPKPTPTPAPVTTAGVVGALGFLAVITGLPIWGVVKIVKKFKKIN